MVIVVRCSWQEKKVIDTFLGTFTKQIRSDSAQKAFDELQLSLKDVTNCAGKARLLLMEVILAKAIDNHQRCQERGDAAGGEEAIALIKGQLEFLADNNLGLTEANVLGPLLKYARQALP